MRPTQQTRPRCTVRRERGIAMVEFAVGTPLIFLLLYAICEFGNVYAQYSTLADASRSADRYLASNALLGSTGVVNLSGTLVQAAQNLAVFGNIVGNGAPVLPGLTTGEVTIAVDASNNVSVAVAYPYQSLFGGTLPDFIDSGSTNTNFTLTVYTSMVAL